MVPSYSGAQLVLVDGAIAGAPALIAALPGDYEAILLRADGDCYSQIHAALAGRDGLAAIHIISHGGAGQLQLGGSLLNTAQPAADLWRELGSHLSTTGDLLLYGCDLAAGAQGRHLVQQIAQWSQADVAASTDLTGPGACGGDWTLEYQVGRLEHAAPFGALWSGGGPLLALNAAPTLSVPTSIAFASRIDAASGASPAALACADLDGDGKADLISVNAADNSLSALFGLGDGNFAGKVDYLVGNRPLAVVATDVDGDGKIDLVAVNSGDNTLSVLVNQGDGSFLPPSDYVLGAGPNGLASADVDGDGLVDLIGVNETAGTLSVLKNLGAGAFAAKVDYTVGAAPAAIVAADVDGDGLADLIVSNRGDNTLSVLKNLGAGTFAPRTDYATGSAPQGVACADVDGDGKPDLIVANGNDNTLSVLRNLGDGTFAAKADYAAGHTPVAVAVADVDSDGHPDLIVTNNGDSSMSVLRNNGDGTFAARTDYATGANPGALVSADMNGDGKADVVTANDADNTVSVLVNAGAAPATAFTEQTAVAVSPAIRLDDADGDWAGGSLSVQVTNHGEAADSLRLPASDPGGAAIWLDSASGQLMAGNAHIGDASAGTGVNGAAWTFVFTAAANNALVQATARAVQFDNSSDTPDTSARAITFTATDSHGAHVSAVQTLNVMAVDDAPTLAGLPGAALAVTVGQATAAPAITVADVDSVALTLTLTTSNGTLGRLADLDPATPGIQLAGTAAAINSALAGATFTAAASGAATVNLSLSDGHTTVNAQYNMSANASPTMALPTTIAFAGRHDYATGNQPRGLASADVDGDGKADLIVTNWGDSTLSVLTNLGDGTFAARQDYAVGSAPRAVASADVNGDGKPDVMTVNYFDNTVSVLANRGDGSFAAKHDYATDGNPENVVAADLDGDHVPDLIVSNQFDKTLSTLKNQGDGSYAPRADYATGDYPAAIAVADVDGDGKTDVIAANYRDHTISVLKNQGDGTLAARINYVTDGNPGTVVCADLDGDGKPDLIVANAISNTVAVLRNLGDGTFGTEHSYALGDSPSALACTDVDGDGKLDVIVTSFFGDTVSVLRNQGDGSFAARIDYAAGTKPEHIISADVNGDGKVDLITGNTDDNSVSVLLNAGVPLATAFTEQTAIAVSPAIRLDDADGDWAGGSLSVQVTDHGGAADSLRLPASDPGGAAIWLDPASGQLMAGNVHIGDASAAVGVNGAAWTFVFTAAANNALVQATARAVQFDNSSDTPDTSTRAITFTATDSHGAHVSAVQTLNVTAVDDAPTLTGLPGAALAVAVGQATAAPAITVADVDSVALTLTLTTSNGTLGHLADLDPATPGIQLAGTAAAINGALAAAILTADAAGAGAVDLSLSDGHTTVHAQYALNAITIPTPPAPPAPSDNDGVSDPLEDGCPGLVSLQGGAPVTGDGNGDGISDHLQSAVTSLPVLQTALPQSEPLSAPSRYITLVAGGTEGKVDANAPAAIHDLLQLDAPSQLPSELAMPMGQFAYACSVPRAGQTETFSLYVDADVAVNGYWQLDAAGVWANLASPVYGGKLVIEGGKTRLDYTITDGGQFDSDGKADGVITDHGGAGDAMLSIVGHGPILSADASYWW